MDASLIVSIISSFGISVFFGICLFVLKNWINKRINGKLERIEKIVKINEWKLDNIDKEVKDLKKEFIDLRIKTEKINNFCQLKK